jgi:hypothetical protein
MDIQLPMQSVSITTKVVNSNTVRGEVYSMQHYVIKFVRDLQQVSDVLRILHYIDRKLLRFEYNIKSV